MFDLIEFQVCAIILCISLATGFIPRLVKSYKKCRKKSAIKESKKHFRNINDYDDYDEDLYVLELEKDELENARLHESNRDAYDHNGKPKVNFLMNAVSLVIGFQSTVSLIGVPVEFYYHGFKSLQLALSLISGPIIIAVFFVPFIYKMRSNSVYEYLDDKFNDSKSVKYFTVLLMILFQLTFASLVLFSTSNTVMQILSLIYDIDLWPIVVVLGIVSFGLALLGLKSIIWANFLQYIIMIICNLTVIILGLKYFEGNSSASVIQGVGLVWNITDLSGHDKVISFKENFHNRYTLWNGLIGMAFNTIPTYCLTQQSYMRIKQAKSLRSARWLVLSIIPFGILNIVFIVFLGAVIFAYFYKCGDPVANGTIKNQNQLLSKFLTQFYTQYTGLIGFYMALLISSAINSVASTLKGLSVTFSEDIAGNFFTNFNQKKPKSPELVNSSYKMRRFSDKYGVSDEKEILNFQIRFNTSRNKRKLLREYEKKQRRPNHRVAIGAIVFSGILTILAAIALERSSDSLTSTAMSLLNSIHGPLLFIYICARFNEYSAERNNYAHNRSTTSKLHDFYIHYFDVILSCVLAISFLQFIYFGRMMTYNDYKDFYTSDHLRVSNQVLESNVTFCQENNPARRFLYGNSSSEGLNDSFVSVRGYVNEPVVGQDNWKYLFGISFNWFPFIGLMMCFIVLSVISLIKWIFYRSWGCLMRCC